MNAPSCALHPESLLRIPALRQVFADPNVRLVPRGVDRRWRYHGVIQDDPVGFNVATDALFYAARCAVADWLPHKDGSARPFNHQDRLVRESIGLAHDYLHAWCWQWTAALRPELGLGEAPITSENLDDLAFCFLLAEAAATVGLDYWYLNRLDLNDVVDVGTGVDRFAVVFHERHLREYRRFRPDLDTQSPAFFVEKALFYCSGVFEGFSREDLRSSALLHAWFKHELEYGEMQRIYARQWLADLAEEDIARSEAELVAPVDAAAPWKRALIEEVADRLWRKIHRDELQPAPGPAPFAWRHQPGRRIDFRFTNYNTRRDAGGFSMDDVWRVSEDALFDQFVAQFDYDAFDLDLLPVLAMLRQQRDLDAAERLLRGQPRLETHPLEPDELFLLP